VIDKTSNRYTQQDSKLGSRSGRTVVGFTTTRAINIYHHYSCDFQSLSGEVY